MDTVTTKTLNPQAISHLLDGVLIVASDIDDTLLDTASGLEAGVAALGEKFGNDLADLIFEMRQLTLWGARKLPDEPWDERDKYNELLEKSIDLQSSFANTYGFKKWSREVWIRLAAQKLGLSLSPEEIEQARDLYWDEHTKAAALYDYTEPFLSLLKEKNIPLILMTASSSNMRVSENKVDYDPHFSAEYKKNNFDTLKISYDDFLTGDPIDKPHPSFYDRVEESIKKILGFTPKPEQILAVGDSPLNDLFEPKKRGWKTLLIEKEES